MSTNSPALMRSTAVAFHATDEAWQAALEARFGKRAREARYSDAGKGEPGSSLRSLYAVRHAAYAAWCEARNMPAMADPVCSGVTVANPPPVMVATPCQQQQAKAARGRQRSHRVVLTVVFDRPCTLKHAVEEVRQNIHGDFYPQQHEDSDPGLFRVRSVARAS